jgi:hypothetical protein
MQTEPRNELKGVEFSNETSPQVNTCLLSGALSTRGSGLIRPSPSRGRLPARWMEEMADHAAGNGEER